MLGAYVAIMKMQGKPINYDWEGAEAANEAEERLNCETTAAV